MNRMRCENFVLKVLPSVRAIVAKELVDRYNFTHKEAARAIGTTRPAISQYLSSKRGAGMIRKLKSDPELKKMLDSIVESIANKKISREELEVHLCEVCKKLQLKSCTEVKSAP